MTTHHQEFMKKIDAGIAPNIYVMQPEGKEFFRLYDGNSQHCGNHNHHACIASKLSETAANAAVVLSKQDPSAFADTYL